MKRLAVLALVLVVAWPGPNPIDWVKNRLGNGHGPDVVVEHPRRLDCGVRIFQPKGNAKRTSWRARNMRDFDFEKCRRIGFHASKVGALPGGPSGPVVYFKLRADRTGDSGTATASGPHARGLGDRRHWRDIRALAA